MKTLNSLMKLTLLVFYMLVFQAKVRASEPTALDKHAVVTWRGPAANGVFIEKTFSKFGSKMMTLSADDKSNKLKGNIALKELPKYKKSQGRMVCFDKFFLQQ